ncbi:MAG: zinc ribbon domain-containing protein [Clostridiales bacterium]
MSFIESIGKKVGNAAHAAVKKSGEIVEAQKISVSIKSEEDKINNFYVQVGKLIYNEYYLGKEIDESVKDICNQLKETEIKIKDLKTKLAEVKKIKRCAICGKEIEKSKNFCTLCGSKQDISLMPKDDDYSFNSDKIECKNCSYINDIKDELCIKCGDGLK